MLVVLIILVLYAMNHSDPNSRAAYGRPGKSHPASSPATKHPIDTLIEEGDRNFDTLMSKESTTLQDAAATYRKRRGRHPPPGFNVWYEFAKNRSSIIVEDFFDQIYHDLEPFWGMAPMHIRREANGFEMTIHVRNGKATTESDWNWTLIWLDLFESMEHLLPDMDLAMNPMDEPRIVAHWEDIDAYMQKAAMTRKMTEPQDVENSFQLLRNPKESDMDVDLIGQTFESTSEFMAYPRFTLNETDCVY